LVSRVENHQTIVHPRNNVVRLDFYTEG
jgi:hypothetical protein